MSEDSKAAEDIFPEKEEKISKTIPISKEDEASLDKMLGDYEEKDTAARVRSVLKPQGIKKILEDSKNHLRSVQDALLIADRWNPRNKLDSPIIDEQTKETLRLEAGNMKNIDDLEPDAIYLLSLNAKVSMLWALSKAAVHRAESYRESLISNSKKIVAEARRAGHLKGKVSSVDQANNIAENVKAIRQATADLLDVKEQAEILGSCYYANKELADVLAQRARTLSHENTRARRLPE